MKARRRNSLLSIVFLLAFLPAYAQLGFTVASTMSATPDWQVVVENYLAKRHTEFLRYGTTINIDYTFPLKNEAIRLQPTLHYVRTSWGFYPHFFEVYAIGAQFNMNFALLPATNLQGRPAPFRPFLQIYPGLDLVRKKYEDPPGDGGTNNGETSIRNDLSVAMSAGASLLLEFKLTELLTVSPLIGIRIYPNINWKGFTEVVSDGQMAGTFDRTHWRQWMLGLRMGLDLKGK